ncbi:unnamed protein product, partial [Mesorhabditis belari]|uniref:Uncharacterized protein n=1 Tax=Mesorhabditis belari TaxID=2138241 RepID=A0AAF3FBM2_9BILA
MGAKAQKEDDVSSVKSSDHSTTHPAGSSNDASNSPNTSSTGIEIVERTKTVVAGEDLVTAESLETKSLEKEEKKDDIVDAGSGDITEQKKNGLMDTDKLDLGDIKEHRKKELETMTDQKKVERTSAILTAGFELAYRFKEKQELNTFAEKILDGNFVGNTDAATTKSLAEYCLLLDSELRDDLLTMYTELKGKLDKNNEDDWYNLWEDEVNLLVEHCEKRKSASIRARVINSGTDGDNDRFLRFSIGLGDETITITLNEKLKRVMTGHAGVENLLTKCAVSQKLGFIDTLITYLAPTYMNLLNGC